jgi:hypothetical protein
MIKRSVARYNSQTGKWEWGRAAEKIEILNARAPLSAARSISVLTAYLLLLILY